VGERYPRYLQKMINMELYKGMRDENNGLLDLISELPAMETMLEIGSFAGESGLMFYNSGKFKSITCVDCWIDPINQKRMDEAERSFDVRVGNKVKKIKAYFSKDLNLPKFDFIYIDANHSYESVKHDIMLAKKLIKEGGIIAGHDYRSGYAGLMDAVNEEFTKIIRYRDSSWKAI
jgi:predicted O-methyltransferase YrrM